NTYMMKGEQQKIFHKGSNRKINAFITLHYPSNKIKFKISKSRTSTDFIDRIRSVGNYIKKNKIKRFILITDNASFHVSKKAKQFIEKTRLVNCNISSKTFTKSKPSKDKGE
ncbi:MAG: transposase, partial [Candidatus Nitrosopolaris sp.]